MLVHDKELDYLDYEIQIISPTLALPAGLSAIFTWSNLSFGRSVIHCLYHQYSTAMSSRTCPYQVISTNIRNSLSCLLYLRFYIIGIAFPLFSKNVLGNLVVIYSCRIFICIKYFELSCSIRCRLNIRCYLLVYAYAHDPWPPCKAGSENSCCKQSPKERVLKVQVSLPFPIGFLTYKQHFFSDPIVSWISLA